MLLAGLAPVVCLVFYSVPQADDFFYGALAREHGLAGGIAEMYGSWSGRFLISWLIMLPTVLADETGAALIDPVRGGGLLMLGALAGLAFYTARLVIPKAAGWPAGLAGLVFLYVLLANARSLRDTLYWVPGFAPYAVPAVIGAALYAWLHGAAARGERVPPGHLLWLCPLLAVTAGANEFTGPALVTIVAASVVLRAGLGGRPLQPLVHAALALAALAGTAIVLAAPGNDVRVAQQSAGGDVLETLVWGPIYFLNYLALRVDSPGLAGWLLLVALAVRGAERISGTPSPARPLLVWMPLAVFAAYGLLAFSAGVYGLGSLLPGRAQNQVHLTFMVLASLSAAEAARFYGPALSAWLQARAPQLDRRRLALIAVVLIALSPQSWRAAYDLLSGEAAGFAAENRTRLAKLEESPARKKFLVPAWQHRPALLVQEDMAPDPLHWINLNIADYYGHAAVATGTDWPDESQ
ncbi:MAG: hypothetical protein GVY13_04455 [Alphaproteobacteria bacterium]|nr:hypothetical protein [Alphaproteobacteria bacterium]